MDEFETHKVKTYVMKDYRRARGILSMRTKL